MLTITPNPAVLGATITGLDLRSPLADDLVLQVRDALLRYEVVFFPKAALTPLEQVRLGRMFGTLQSHVALDSLVDVPEVVVFDTAKKATTAEWWHADVTCAPEPPMGAMLQMVIESRSKAIDPAEGFTIGGNADADLAVAPSSALLLAVRRRLNPLYRRGVTSRRSGCRGRWVGRCARTTRTRTRCGTIRARAASPMRCHAPGSRGRRWRRASA